jgi:tellurite resistance protein
MDRRRLFAPWRLPVVPAALFGMVLGLASLGFAWRAAHAHWGLPAVVAEALLAVAATVWAVLLLLFAAKWIGAREAALAEWRHPVQCCFISLIPIATLLVALAAEPHEPVVARGLFWLGLAGQLGFGIWRAGGLLRGGRAVETTTPVLYLPNVGGSFVSSAAASAFGQPGLAVALFGAGVLAWLAIESIVTHRLLTAPALPPPLRPTIGIQYAPPVVGLSAWLSLNGGAVDTVALMLLGYGVLQALLVLRLTGWIAEQPFSAGYWAFTFGAGALAAGAIRLAAAGAPEPVVSLAPVAFVAVNLLIGGIALGTLGLLWRGRLVPPPSA